MPFKVKQLNPIDTSSLDKLGIGVKNLAKYTVDEFGEVASALQGTEPEVIWYSVPPKPRRGTIVYADGTNWNPGFGEGPYWFDGTLWHSGGPGLASIAMLGSYLGSYLRSYLAGLTLSTAGSSTTFSVAAGVAADNTNVDILTLTAPISKTTSAWAVGAGSGALDTGAIAASTWYHVWLIKRTDTQVVDVLVSLSATAPTMPTNYTEKRRIGSMKTNASSQWTSFVQLGDEFLWVASVADVSSATLTLGTPLVSTLTVPTGIQVTAIINAAFNAGSSIAVLVNSPDQNAVASPVFPNCNLVNAAAGGAAAGHLLIRTNTSAQVRSAATATISSGYSITTQGWIDRRGRDA